MAALAGKPVRIASAGHEHSAILTEAGEVYTMGEGSRGQLGHAELGYTHARLAHREHIWPQHHAPLLTRLLARYSRYKHVPKLVEALAPPLTATQVKGLKVGELTKELARLGIAAKEELGKLRKEELAKHLLAAQPERARVVEVAAGTNRTFAKTADGWMYSCRDGHYHNRAIKSWASWASGEPQGIKKGQTVGLLLRRGSLAVYIQGRRVGVMCTDLSGPLVWAADLCYYGGSSVRIERRPPPSPEPEPGP